MNTYLKLLSFLLACLLMLSSFVGCEQGTEQSESDDSGSADEITTEIETERTPLIDRNDYDSDFFLSIYHGSNVVKFHWVEEGENDVLTEAIFARQEKIRDYLGVKIVGSEAGTYTQYAAPFMNSVKTKSGAIDMMLSHVYASIPTLVSSNYLTDISTLPGVDLNADYWNQEFMEDLSIHGKYYLGNSDYNILYTHVISFNKEMMEKYAGALEKSVYDMVRDYEWTIDEMLSLANLVYIDETSNGKTIDDIYGITGRQWNEFPGFLHASNINMIEQNEAGNYEVALLNDINGDKVYALVDKLHNLAKSDCAWFDYATTSAPSISITTGRTLLHLSETISLDKYLDYEIQFGVLPYPMYDTAQKDVGYRHLQWGGYILIPSFLKNVDMVGETLELLSFYSDNVKLAYYEKMLGKQVADAVDDSQMLEIVWDSVCCEFAQTYSEVIGGNNLLYLMANVTQALASPTVASSIATLARSSNGAIRKFFDKIEKANMMNK